MGLLRLIRYAWPRCRDAWQQAISVQLPLSLRARSHQRSPLAARSTVMCCVTAPFFSLVSVGVRRAAHSQSGAGPTPRCRRLFLTRSARLRMMTQLRLPTSESAEAWGTSQSDMHSSRWSTGVSSPSPFSVRPGWPAPEPKVASDEYLLT